MARDFQFQKGEKFDVDKGWDAVEHKGWWMSEKLDGFRCLWDGRRLCTREFNIIDAPLWFTADLPSDHLDGELWAGRGALHIVQSIKGKQDIEPEAWGALIFMVFDAPLVPGPFSSTYEWTKRALVDCEFATHVPQEPIQNAAQLKRVFDAVVARGGEGLMLRDPTQQYIRNRTKFLLKYKEQYCIVATAMSASKKAKMGAQESASWTFSCEGFVKGRLQTFNVRSFKDPHVKVTLKVDVKCFGTTHTGVPRHAMFLRLHTGSGSTCSTRTDQEFAV